MEHQRTLGFLPPDQLLPALLLGIAKVHFDAERWPDARSHLDELLEKHPRSWATPEALYLRGVCSYRLTRNRESMMAAFEELDAQFPESEWTVRISPYRNA